MARRILLFLAIFVCGVSIGSLATKMVLVDTALSQTARAIETIKMWEKVAQTWKKAAEEIETECKMWRAASTSWRDMAVAIAEKESVCVSMLPAEQRKSLTGK